MANRRQEDGLISAGTGDFLDYIIGHMISLPVRQKQEQERWIPGPCRPARDMVSSGSMRGVTFVRYVGRMAVGGQSDRNGNSRRVVPGSADWVRTAAGVKMHRVKPYRTGLVLGTWSQTIPRPERTVQMKASQDSSRHPGSDRGHYHVHPLSI